MNSGKIIIEAMRLINLLEFYVDGTKVVCRESGEIRDEILNLIMIDDNVIIKNIIIN